MRSTAGKEAMAAGTSCPGRASRSRSRFEIASPRSISSTCKKEKHDMGKENEGKRGGQKKTKGNGAEERNEASDGKR